MPRRDSRRPQEERAVSSWVARSRSRCRRLEVQSEAKRQSSWDRTEVLGRSMRSSIIALLPRQNRPPVFLRPPEAARPWTLLRQPQSSPLLVVLSVARMPWFLALTTVRRTSMSDMPFALHLSRHPTLHRAFSRPPGGTQRSLLEASPLRSPSSPPTVSHPEALGRPSNRLWAEATLTTSAIGHPSKVAPIRNVSPPGSAMPLEAPPP
mmetsp:Transcript_17213/g.37046  ORF Transcript_17213/g.37046 Transcript_17213/m.37046 type:complete len:208 (-) Transcript_17213:450-1073(-)